MPERHAIGAGFVIRLCFVCVSDLDFYAVVQRQGFKSKVDNVLCLWKCYTDISPLLSYCFYCQETTYSNLSC